MSTPVLTQREHDIIYSMAENNQCLSVVAEAVHYHRNTLLYYIQKIQKKTGLDPRNFYDLAALLGMA